MTNKQKRKIAKQIYDLEKIRDDKNSSPEEKKNAENKIIQIVGKISSLPDGMFLMLDIDEIIQENLK